MAGNKNPLVLDASEKIEYTPDMINAIYRCKQSVLEFIKYVHIVHPTEGKIPIQPTEYQIRLLQSLSSESRLIILQPRQSYKTTTVSIFLTWFAMFNSYKNCAIVANKDATAVSIMEDIKVIYENLPKWLKMPCHTYNAHTIGFTNGSQIFAAATSKNGLAGESVSFLYMDEVALIEPASLAEDFWKANYPTISHGEKIVLTSTPRGVGNLFHTVWKGAVEKTNNFKPFRVDYWEVPTYMQPGWKEYTISDIGPISFNSEYGNQFLGSSATLISAEALQNMNTQDAIQSEAIMGGQERRYREFEKGQTYIASLDIAMGSGNDYSVLNIFKTKHHEPNLEDIKEYKRKGDDVPEIIVDSLEQVFIFRSNLCSIPDLTRYVFDILPQWGNPYFIFENNGIGQSFVDRMQESYYYENVYLGEGGEFPGINSNTMTKSKMASLLKQYADNRKLIVYDIDTINELMTYVEKKTISGNRKFLADGCGNDDCAVSCGWACYLADSVWFQDVISFH
jgi:hypothetical protein